MFSCFGGNLFYVGSRSFLKRCSSEGYRHVKLCNQAENLHSVKTSAEYMRNSNHFVSGQCRTISTRSNSAGSHSRVYNSACKYNAGCMFARLICPVDTLQLCSYSTSAGIQKHVSVLTAKRPLRKKVMSSKGEKSDVKTLTAYAVAEELNLDHLRKVLENHGLYIIKELPIDVTDALFVQAKYTVDEQLREIFFFSEGCAVFWNMPAVERKEALRFLQKHSEAPYDMNLVIHEHEHLDFQYTKEPTTQVGDVVQLCETEIEEGHMILEKYTFSNTMSQSVKLAVWECSLEKFVESIESVTEDLRDGKKISMSRREVLRRTGELFALRHGINLSSDLLDTPDFYWDRDVLEPLYQRSCNHLNIHRRTKVMNEKLSHCCELMELLSSHLNDAHHTRLEVMIIVLILVEVVFEIIHYVERYLSAYQHDEHGEEQPGLTTTPP